MSILQTLLETEESQNFLNENQDFIMELSQEVDSFGEIIKEYIDRYPDEFLAESLDETFKNIRVFAEFATCAYINELTSIHGQAIAEQQAPASTDTLSEYL